MIERDVELDDGRRLHAYDTGGDDRLAVLWHHGTPNIGAPPVPLFATAERLGLRWVAYDRPGYGGSTPRPDRDVASAAADGAAVADALGLARFAVIGHSGGGAHALACAARDPDRVVAAVSVAGLAPYGAAGLDWFAGMGPTSEATLRAAVAGRDARERYEGGEPDFTPADVAALDGAWRWLLDVVRPALAGGPAAAIDDDLAYVRPWGFDPASVAAPTLIVHGGADRVVPAAHGEWLAAHCGPAELRRYEGDGHISVLAHAEAALGWLRAVSP